MDVLFLLIPLSVVVMLFLIGVFAWALGAGQMDDLEHQAQSVLEDE